MISNLTGLIDEPIRRENGCIQFAGIRCANVDAEVEVILKANISPTRIGKAGENGERGVAVIKTDGHDVNRDNERETQ